MKPDYPPFFNVTVVSAEQSQTVPAPIHSRVHFEIVWFQRGTGILEVNAVKHIIDNQSIYCGAPGQLQQLHTENQLHGIVIAFNELFIQEGYEEGTNMLTGELMSEFLQFTAVEMNDAMAAEFSVLIGSMRSELLSDRKLKGDILRFYLRIMFIHIQRQLLVCPPSIATPGVNFLVKKFLARIEHDFVQRKSVSEYASLLCVTPNYLNQVVKKSLGETAGYFIRKRIISEAKKRALHSNLTMKEIAFLLGFDSEAHFSIYFKNYAGMNFTDYKKMPKESAQFLQTVDHVHHARL